MKTKYDIFVSYRRSSSESANLITTRLRAEGYRVFFDVESMRGGKFNEQLFDVIDDCTDFLLILPPNALNRCNDPEDWVRKEVLRAIDGKKNIVPIMLSGFSWPNPMPQGMEDLPLYQAVTASSVEYFDLSMRRLIEQYLKSKPKHYRLLKRVGLFITILFLLIGMLFGGARLLSYPLCDKFSTEMTDHLVRLDLLGGYLEKNNSEWNEFIANIQKATTPRQLVTLMEHMSNNVGNTRILISQTAPSDSLPKQYSLFDSFLFASRGISIVEVEIEPVLAASYFSEFIPNLDYIDTVLVHKDFGSITRKNVDSNAQLAKHLLALAYYSYMELMSQMPKKSQKRYLEIASQFKHLPNDVPLTLTREEYLQKQNNENAICERILLDLEAFTNNASLQLDEFDNKVSAVEGMLNAMQEINEIAKTNEAEIALRKEKIEAKKQINRQKVAQLEELDKEYLKSFEELKANCALNEEDEKWYKWGKIVKFATFMESIAQSRKKLEAQGIYATSAVTPDVAYANLASMLNKFKQYHPESAMLAESAKAYYKEVSKGKTCIEGVIISAIKDDMKHPVHRVGDIIISMKGQYVTNYDELKAAFKNEGSPKEIFLRLEDGKLEEHSVDDCGSTNILGYSNLKQ